LIKPPCLPSNETTKTTSSWDGRPKTPPFQWSDAAGGEATAPHDAWMSALDPAREGLGALQEPEFLAAAPGGGAADLALVKDLLVQHAGAGGGGVDRRWRLPGGWEPAC
jgi:hypothetical protein